MKFKKQGNGLFLITTLHVDSDYDLRVPESATIPLDPSEIKRLFDMLDLIVKHKLCTIEFFETAETWSFDKQKAPELFPVSMLLCSITEDHFGWEGEFELGDESPIRRVNFSTEFISFKQLSSVFHER